MQLLNDLIAFEPTSIILDKDVFVELVKTLYCPKKKDPSKFTFEEIRKGTMHIQKKYQIQV